MKNTAVFFLIWVFISVNTIAHENESDLPKTSLGLSSALAFRDQSAVGTGESWMVPGAQLGGEAVPADKGLNLDDLQLQGSYNIDDMYSFSAKLSAHSHNDENTIELENAWFTWNASDILTGTVVELGRLSTNVSKTATFHSSQSPFSEAPLLSDVFFGRHFNDMGVKIKSTQGLFSFGLEAWSGNAWPAASNEGALSAYIKMKPTWQNGALSLDAWLMSSHALNRNDDRYDTGHSHGGVTVESLAADIYFTGNTGMTGLLASAHHDIGHLRLLLEAEWIQSQSSGDLNDDSNQQSGYESTYEGMRGLLGLRYKKNQLSIQYEELVLENIFLDSVNIIFLEQTGLQAEGFNPNKLMLAWQWQFHSDFHLRAQWIDDKSASESGFGRSAIGLVWQRKIF